MKQDQWNAFIMEGLVLEPTGPGTLSGLSFAAKDVFSVRGHVNAAGNPDWLRTHRPGEEHAEAVRKLLANGARLQGMTHTDELMFSLNGENVHYGTPVNPSAVRNIPGGSSSGSAVAVAAGAVDFALGTDTGGSVRIPSSYCGIFGIRPTYGLVSSEGVIPLASSFDTVGWMARDAAMLKRVGSVLIREAAESGTFAKVLVAIDAWEAAERESREALADCVSLIEGLVGASRRITLAQSGLSDWVETFRTIQGYEIWETHGDWIEANRPVFGPDIAQRFAWAKTLRRDEFAKRQARRADIVAYMEQLLSDDALLVIPTAPCGAPELGQTGGGIEATRARIMQLSCIAGLTGFPQVTVPAADAGGLPIGISIIAGRGQDRRLLAWIADELGEALSLESSNKTA